MKEILDQVIRDGISKVVMESFDNKIFDNKILNHLYAFQRDMMDQISNGQG